MPTALRLALVTLVALVASSAAGQELEWQDEEVVAVGPPSKPLAGIHVAFNNTRIGVRDAAGRLHLLWSDGQRVVHGVRSDSGEWSVRPISAGASRTTKPTLAFAGEALVAAWGGAQGHGEPVGFAAVSRDGGATWSEPVRISRGPAINVTLCAFDGGAVVAWHTREEGRILAARWDGSRWAEPVVLNGDGDGDGADVSLAGAGRKLVACWEESVAEGSREKDLRLATSADGGRTWSAPLQVRIEGGRVPPVVGDPCVAFDRDGGLLVAYQGAGSVYLAAARRGEQEFRYLDKLGPGLFVHVEIGPDGIFAAWEHFVGDMRNSAAKTAGLAISTDGHSFRKPHAMPGSESATGRLETGVILSPGWVDMVWVEIDDRETRLVVRSARIR